ncbi:MAG: hypothetical protein FWD86_02635, partial [Firmicutes bacterium]|nr:hypothetical protein [Bacillota bacterium]
MKEKSRKISIKLILVYVCTAMLVLALLFNPFTVYSFWGNLWLSITQESDSDGIRIGEWAREIITDTNDFNELFELIRTQDPFIRNAHPVNGSLIHVLGTIEMNNGVLNTPMSVGNIRKYDVLIWKNLAEVTIAVQVMGDVPANSPLGSTWNDIVLSWTSIEAALNNICSIPPPNNHQSPVVGCCFYPLTLRSDVFNPNSHYTTAHAPVLYNGQRWLPRHDGFKGPPALGDDWFLVSDIWHNQVYPIGYFVAHTIGGYTRYYRKSAMEAHGTIAAPSAQSNSYWEVVPLLEAEGMPLFSSQATWPIGSIVQYGEEHYYRAAAANGNLAPPLNSDWRLFARYDAANIVPMDWVSGRSYPARSFVHHNGMYFINFSA